MLRKRRAIFAVARFRLRLAKVFDNRMRWWGSFGKRIRLSDDARIRRIEAERGGPAGSPTNECAGRWAASVGSKWGDKTLKA